MSKGYHSKEYRKLIDENSADWQDLKRRRNLVDDNRCAACGVPVFATKRKSLALHHIYYGDLLDINSVISVCDKCHGILEGRILPKYGDYDPRSKDAQERLLSYIKWTRSLIKGEVLREESMTPGNSGPEAYLQYQKKADRSTQEG